tara:strand:- start:552 stop:1901 length:1350 start_codon:yes stop_codon:yes gene_type:complete
MLKKHEHECELIIGSSKKIVSKIKKFKPNFIAISGMHVEKEWIKKVTREIKRFSNNPIIVGGSIVLSAPEIIKNRFIDALVFGESEYSVVEIADRIHNKKSFSDIPGIITCKNNLIIRNKEINTIHNLDELPFPDRDIYKEYYNILEKGRSTLFKTSRGCAYKCSFCFYNTLKNQSEYPVMTRKRSVKNIIEEIKSINKKNPIKRIHFFDSIFITNKKWLMKFLKIYKKEINIPFTCNAHYNFIDEEIIRELKKSHCHTLQIGIESGDDYFRNKILKKNISNNQIIKIARLLHKYKLKFISLNMMVFPGETFEQAMKTVRINQKIKPDYVSVDMLLHYPNLEVTNYALKNGYLKKEKLELLSKNNYKMSRSILDQKNLREISNLQKFAILLILYPSIKPIIMQLIKLPENKIFDYIFAVTTYLQFRSFMKFSIQKIFGDAIRNYKTFLD